MAAMVTTTGGGLRSPSLHVGGGVERRALHHEERAAHREALERGTATTRAGRTLPVVTMSAASVDVHVDAPNYRPHVTLESKKKRTERKRAKAMRKWELGTHQPEGVAGAASGATDPAENVDPFAWAPRRLRTSRRMAKQTLYGTYTPTDPCRPCCWVALPKDRHAPPVE